MVMDGFRVSRRSALKALGLVGAGSLSGCLGGGGGQDDDRVPFVEFNAGFEFDAQTVPWFVGLANDFYEDEGIGVNLQEGQGSQEAVRNVSGHVQDIGQGSISAVLSGYAEDPNLPLKFVGASIPLAPNGFFYIEGRDGIEGPADIEGKTVGLVPGSGDAALYPFIFADMDFTMDDVEVRDVTFGTRFPLLAEGEIQLAAGWLLHYPVVRNIAMENDIDPDRVQFFSLEEDYGVVSYGDMLFVNTDWLADNEDLTGAFLRGSVSAYQFSNNNPDQAFEQWHTYNSERDAETEQAKFEWSRRQWVDDHVAENGYFQISEDKIEQSVALAEELLELDQTPPLDELYTNEYLPTVIP